ncbi:MAG: RimK-like protein [Rhodocyclales bacterium]|nr:RimK-like protein [Rhodocyclales bacterium]
MANHPVEVLILTGILDIPTDRICHLLRKNGVPFLRINRDALSDVALTVDPKAATMICRTGGNTWEVGSALKSVWWRQATFLRNTPSHALSTSEQLERSQWSAFMRGMMLFDEAVWMNDPAATYKAESKPYQLRRAAKLGFSVPKTIVTNDPHADIPKLVGLRIALKSVDTVLLHDSSHQHFGYTTLIDWSECADEHFHLAPATCQAPIEPKLDLRVTVLGDRIWCDEIRLDQGEIEGDWRLHSKDHLHFNPYDLPREVAKRCVQLTRDLGLRYGAIDLAFSKETYWFIEINPTGEWGWLDREGRGISEAIANELSNPSGRQLDA